MELQQCPEENLYDPFADACRRVRCGEGLYFKDGYCTSTPPPSSTRVTKRLGYNSTVVPRTATTTLIGVKTTTTGLGAVSFVPTKSPTSKGLKICMHCKILNNGKVWPYLGFEGVNMKLALL